LTLLINVKMGQIYVAFAVIIIGFFRKTEMHCVSKILVFFYMF